MQTHDYGLPYVDPGEVLFKRVKGATGSSNRAQMAFLFLRQVQNNSDFIDWTHTLPGLTDGDEHGPCLIADVLYEYEVWLQWWRDNTGENLDV